MKKWIIIWVLLLVGAVHAQNYYNTNSKLFFEQYPVVNDTAHLESLNLHLLQAAVFHKTNLKRKKKLQFEYNEQLEKGAKFHSDEMLNLGFFNHVNRKNKKFKTPALRAKHFKAPFTIIGENIVEEIAINYKSNSLYDTKEVNGKYTFYDYNSGRKLTELTYEQLADKIVESWMDSPPHRANILDKSYSHLGVGISIMKNPYGSDDPPVLLATQLFGGN